MLKKETMRATSLGDCSIMIDSTDTLTGKYSRKSGGERKATRKTANTKTAVEEKAKRSTEARGKRSTEARGKRSTQARGKSVLGARDGNPHIQSGLLRDGAGRNLGFGREGNTRKYSTLPDPIQYSTLPDPILCRRSGLGFTSAVPYRTFYSLPSHRMAGQAGQQWGNWIRWRGVCRAMSKTLSWLR